MSGPAAIAENTRTVLEGLGFARASYRYPIELQAEGGADRRFTIDIEPAEQQRQVQATPENVRRLRVVVRVAYFRGGGDAGGVSGGDRRSVNQRASRDMFELATALEVPEQYGSGTTGVRRVMFEDFARTVDGKRSEVWDLRMIAEWEAPAALVEAA